MRTFLTAMTMCAACATGGANYGSVTFKASRAAGAPPSSYTVGPRHISGSLANAYVEDGCVRGTMGRLPLTLCDEGNGHWTGASGDLHVATQGNDVLADGYLQLGAGRRVELANERIPLGQGTQWDELRRTPVLAAIASTAADLAGGNLELRRGY